MGQGVFVGSWRQDTENSLFTHWSVDVEEYDSRDKFADMRICCICAVRLSRVA